jgi:hypothetical protein
MSEGADGCHVENRVRVLAIIYASFREDDGDEVDARIAKQWNGGAVRESCIDNVNQCHLQRKGTFGLPSRPHG